MEKSSYYGVKAVSNSALSYINPEERGCPQKFFDFLEGRLDEKESKAMITGTLVHAKIFEPETLEVVILPKISDNVKEIVDRLMLDLDLDFADGTLSSYQENIPEHAAAIGYGQSWKPETLIKKVLTEGGAEYYSLMLNMKDKTPVDPDVNAKLVNIEAAIRSNVTISNALIGDDQPGIEYLNELEVFWDYIFDDGKVIKCKSKIDRVKVDHHNKTFKIIDLKTTSESIEFYPKLFADRRHYRQLAFYESALISYFEEEYSPEEYHSIVVCETSFYNRVRKFDVSPQYIQNGHVEISSLMKRIQWHLDNNEKVASYEDILSDFNFLLE